MQASIIIVPTYIVRSLYYPKRWESGCKDDWWAFLPIQVHQWREGVNENEPFLSTYCVHWTISYFILLWNWASERSSNLPRDTQPLFGNQGLTPYLWLQSYCSLHPWSNYCLTCCWLWCSLQIWVRKGLFFTTFSSAPIRLKQHQSSKCVSLFAPNLCNSSAKNSLPTPF